MKSQKISLKIISSIVIFLVSFCFSAEAWCESDWEQGISQISEDLYVGKIKDQKLWLVMERVSENNIELWRKYAEVQYNALYGCFNEVRINMPKKKSLSDGLSRFKLALNIDLDIECERWVAYITSDPLSRGISQDVGKYTYDSIVKYYNDISTSGMWLEEKSLPVSKQFNENVKMFVIVVSSQNALITSHVGLSTSIEGVINRIGKQVSMDLHSFAAKVMLKRNQKRKYLVYPTFHFVAQKITQKLPSGSVSIGTLEMRKVMEERANESFESYCNNLLTSNLISEGSYNQQGMNLYLLRDFREYQNPFSLSLSPPDLSEHNSPGETGAFLEILKTNPPIISVDEGEGIGVRDAMNIHDPKNPEQVWLTIDQNNRQQYAWLFNPLFKQSYTFHYIAVDLQGLANATKLDNAN